jgi:hypothetical protein
MRFEPPLYGGTFPISQHLDDLVPLQVHQQCAIAVALLPGKIIDTYCSNGSGHRNWHLHQMT